VPVQVAAGAGNFFMDSIVPMRAITLVMLAAGAFAEPNSGPALQNSTVGQVHSPTLHDKELQAMTRSLLAGLSTTLGAIVVLLPNRPPSPPELAFALALAGGVMVTVSFVELWLPHILTAGWRWQAAFWSALGAALFFFLSRLVPEPGSDLTGSSDIEDQCDHASSPAVKHRSKQWRLATLMMLALTAHNFPEGLAVAVSSMESERLGLVVMVAIAVHNVPEGIAIAMPVMDASGSRCRALTMATMSGLAEPLGAFLALAVLPPWFLHGRNMDALLCIVGGIMTSVAIFELFPEAQAQKCVKSACAGFFAGVMVMLTTHAYA